jgi:hypothetical protein
MSKKKSTDNNSQTDEMTRKKRKSLLQNTERRHAKMAEIIPDSKLTEYEMVGSKIKAARAGEDSAEASYLVEVAASAQSVFLEPEAATGLKVYMVNQGRRGILSLKSKEQREKWKKTAAVYIERNPSILKKWGWKSLLARHVAKIHNVNVETVRRALREVGITKNK